MLWGLPRAHAERIVECRGERVYRSIDDFARRTGLGRAAIMRLAKAGVFGSLEINRRQSLWDALVQDQTPMPLFDAAESTDAASTSANHTVKRQSSTDTIFLP